MHYSKIKPTAPGYYWVRRIDGTDCERIAEVVPCDPLDRRPPGSMKLSLTRAEEADLNGYEYAGPLRPPATVNLGDGADRDSFDM